MNDEFQSLLGAAVVHKYFDFQSTDRPGGREKKGGGEAKKADGGGHFDQMRETMQGSWSFQGQISNL